jgi:hypothetical protein
VYISKALDLIKKINYNKIKTWRWDVVSLYVVSCKWCGKFKRIKIVFEKKNRIAYSHTICEPCSEREKKIYRDKINDEKRTDTNTGGNNNIVDMDVPDSVQYAQS